MSSDPTPPPPEQPDQPDEGAAGAEEQPDEEELRRRIEEGLRQVRVQDVLLESVVTLLNLTARRIGKDDERDLEQARIGIEAVRSLVPLLEADPQTQVRNALSELQMLYARAAGGDAPAEEPPEAPERPSDSGLWTPPGT